METPQKSDVPSVRAQAVMDRARHACAAAEAGEQVCASVPPRLAGQIDTAVRMAAHQLWDASGKLHEIGLGGSALAQQLEALGQQAEQLADALAVKMYV